MAYIILEKAMPQSPPRNCSDTKFHLCRSLRLWNFSESSDSVKISWFRNHYCQLRERNGSQRQEIAFSYSVNISAV